MKNNAQLNERKSLNALVGDIKAEKDKARDEKENGIFDQSRIDEVVKRLLDSTVSYYASPWNGERICRFIETYGKNHNLSLDAANLRIADLIMLSVAQGEDDSKNMEYFKARGVTSPSDVRTHILEELRCFIISTVSTQIVRTPSIKRVSHPFEDFCNINYVAYHDYLQSKYQYTLSGDVPKEVILNYSYKGMTIDNIEQSISDAFHYIWLPCNSSEQFYAHKIRRAFEMLDRVIFQPLVEIVMKDYLPEGYTIDEYLVTLSNE